MLGEDLTCKNQECKKKYLKHNGIPILIGDNCISTTVEDIINLSSYSKSKAGSNKYQKLYEYCAGLVPNTSSNTATRAAIHRLNSFLPKKSKVLNVGVLNGGAYLDEIYKNHTVFEVDITIKKGLLCACDLHQLPFFEREFDCVIVQNVLEHVLDPYLCVINILKCLKDSGFVYSEIPFMQQVHAEKFDYTRFTKRGHINLYKNFEIIEAGWVAGPGTALTWAIENFLLSFKIFNKYKRISLSLIRFSFFWIKYFDYIWKNDPTRSIGASSTYLIAKKTENTLSFHEFMKIAP